MKDEMKRVGLIFDAQGNADFRKSLSVTNSALQENRNQFKLTQAQWDNNTKASQKLKDTQAYLSKQYDESTKKVNVLRSELEEMENSENRNEAAINRKKAALAVAEKNLVTYKKELDEVNDQLKKGTADIEEYAKKLDDFGKKTSDLGKKLSKNVTAPLTAVGAASIAAWKEINDAYDGIVTATGATGESLASLQNSFDEVFGSMPVDASDVSDAIGDINTRFGFLDETLNVAAEDFLKFAEINNTDVKSAVALVSRAMGDASIPAQEYGDVLDALTAAVQNSGIGIDKLTENITKYGAPMRALGYDTKESIAMFAAWEKAGVNTEIAFSGMKKAIANFMKEGKDAKVEFKKLVEGVQNGSISAQEAMEIFGTKAGPDLVDAIQEGRFAFDDMYAAVEGSAGKMAETYEATLDPIDKSKVALNDWKLAGAELGEQIQIVLGPIFKGLSDVIKDVTEWFSNLDDGTKQTIVKIGMLALALGPILVIIGKLASSISSIIKLGANMSGLLTKGITFITGTIVPGISTAISTIVATIGWVPLAIGAVIAIIALLWANCEEFREAVIAIWNEIKGAFQQFDEFLETIFSTDWSEHFGFFGEVLNSFFANIKNFWESIKQIFNGIIDFVAGVFTGDWERAWTGVQNIFGGIFEGLKSIAKAPINGIIGLINSAIDAINWMISGINSISFDMPDWLGGHHIGFDIGYLDKINYLAKGGILSSGAAIVAEAGPELLMQQGNRTTVTPLTNGGGAKPVDIIDYDKLVACFIKALKYLKVYYKEDVIGEIIDDRIMEVIR